MWGTCPLVLGVQLSLLFSLFWRLAELMLTAPQTLGHTPTWEALPGEALL